MRLLADLHISPRTVQFLRSLGHDVVRSSEILPLTADDETIVVRAADEQRVVLTQDLGFSTIVALTVTGSKTPSPITLRLFSSRVEYVNTVLQNVLPTLEADVLSGMIVTIEDNRIRRRALPIS
jgi:predicted nuclease of predicted toxin-antitoxin system